MKIQPVYEFPGSPAVCAAHFPLHSAGVPAKVPLPAACVQPGCFYALICRGFLRNFSASCLFPVRRHIAIAFQRLSLFSLPPAFSLAFARPRHP